ncbi:MAG: flavin reductase family protein [Firmicutes bacterium]|nr:flavin reductase family protein [Bacillota bacterium]
MEKTSIKPVPCVYPSAVVLVSTGEFGGPKNIATVAWAADVSAEPPTVCIALRPSRYSHEIISKTGEFVINMPRASQVRETDYCGQVSGRRKDKWADCGFTAVPGRKVRAPLIKECPVNVECAVRNRVKVGTHDIIVAEVLAISADPGVLTDGKIDPSKVDSLTYAHGRYWRTGPPIGEYGFSVSQRRG